MISSLNFFVDQEAARVQRPAVSTVPSSSPRNRLGVRSPRVPANRDHAANVLDLASHSGKPWHSARINKLENTVGENGREGATERTWPVKALRLKSWSLLTASQRVQPTTTRLTGCGSPRTRSFVSTPDGRTYRARTKPRPAAARARLFSKGTTGLLWLRSCVSSPQHGHDLAASSPSTDVRRSYLRTVLALVLVQRPVGRFLLRLRRRPRRHFPAERIAARLLLLRLLLAEHVVAIRRLVRDFRRPFRRAFRGGSI